LTATNQFATLFASLITKSTSVEINPMQRWLGPALDYISRWLEFQMRASEQPGCVIAIAHKDRIVLEQAFGFADLKKRIPLTPRHRFRIASHSKSFTAAGVLKLRERGELKLDDPLRVYLPRHVHPRIAETTFAQILSHSAGLVRDGKDSGQFSDRRPFFNADELIADLQTAPTIEPNTRFKYSNHGFGLLGLVVEAIAREPFTAWIQHEIIDATGLDETYSDMPIPRGTPMASGRSGRLILGERVVIPGRYRTNAIAPAGGVVSTARDTALFFAQLSPNAAHSVLSVSSRREMIRPQWRNEHSSIERYYGLGTISGSLNGWRWFGHTGGLQGYISRTCVIPAHDLTITVFTNAMDGWAGVWVDGAMHILRGFSEGGAPSRKARDWAGRWWSIWGAVDLVPIGDKVLMVGPGSNNPFADAGEFRIAGRDDGRITAADGYASYGEPVRRVRSNSGKVIELWLAASKLLPEGKIANEMRARYGAPVARNRKNASPVRSSGPRRSR
jgi:CubicO group peptidase (beta-lactamase class C family)